MASTINASTTLGLISTADTSGVLQLQTANTTAVTVSATQNVGLGTASPTKKLDILSNTSQDGIRISGSANPRLTIIDTTTPVQFDALCTDTEAVLRTDTNHPLVFSTNGTERMRLDTSGILGLGVTPSAWYTLGGYKVMQIGPGMSFDSGNDFRARIASNAFVNSGGDFKYVNTGFASNYNQASGQHQWYTAASGTAGNTITFTTAMLLDASGNLGIGTTSPSDYFSTASKFVIANTSGDVGMTIATSSTGTGNIFWADATSGTGEYSGYIQYAHNGDSMRFGTNGAERARIDSSGRLLLGQTGAGFSNSNSMAFQPPEGYAVMNHANGTGSGTNYFWFGYNAGSIGTISQNGTTAVSYNTTSDYRLKNSVTPMTGALAKVAQLKPVTYKWNADGSDGEGFIAHELAEVCPHAVTGEKDAVDKDGKPQYQGIDTSFLVATLTAAIQEQQAIIESLKARLDAANL